MLVLSRKEGEGIQLDLRPLLASLGISIPNQLPELERKKFTIRVAPVKLAHGQVRLGIDAPSDVVILRDEIADEYRQGVAKK